MSFPSDFSEPSLDDFIPPPISHPLLLTSPVVNSRTNTNEELQENTLWSLFTAMDVEDDDLMPLALPTAIKDALDAVAGSMDVDIHDFVVPSQCHAPRGADEDPSTPLHVNDFVTSPNVYDLDDFDIQLIGKISDGTATPSRSVSPNVERHDVQVDVTLTSFAGPGTSPIHTQDFLSPNIHLMTPIHAAVHTDEIEDFNVALLGASPISTQDFLPPDFEATAQSPSALWSLTHLDQVFNAALPGVSPIATQDFLPPDIETNEQPTSPLQSVTHPDASADDISPSPPRSFSPARPRPPLRLGTPRQPFSHSNHRLARRLREFGREDNEYVSNECA